MFAVVVVECVVSLWVEVGREVSIEALHGSWVFRILLCCGNLKLDVGEAGSWKVEG
jgi:hypothetical protein